MRVGARTIQSRLAGSVGQTETMNHGAQARPYFIHGALDHFSTPVDTRPVSNRQFSDNLARLETHPNSNKTNTDHDF
jgi:hypothetical protein